MIQFLAVMGIIFGTCNLGLIAFLATLFWKGQRL